MNEYANIFLNEFLGSVDFNNISDAASFYNFELSSWIFWSILWTGASFKEKEIQEKKQTHINKVLKLILVQNEISLGPSIHAEVAFA